MDFDHTRPDHQCAPIENVVEKRKESLTISVSALEKKLVGGNKALQAISNVQENLKTNTQKVKKLINNDKERIKALFFQNLEENAQKRCDEVDEISNVAQEGIVKQQNEIQSFVKEVSESHELAKKILENGTNGDIIETDRVIKNRLENVERKEDLKVAQINVNDGKIKYVQNSSKMLELGELELTGTVSQSCN